MLLMFAESIATHCPGLSGNPFDLCCKFNSMLRREPSIQTERQHHHKSYITVYPFHNWWYCWSHRAGVFEGDHLVIPTARWVRYQIFSLSILLSYHFYFFRHEGPFCQLQSIDLANQREVCEQDFNIGFVWTNTEAKARSCKSLLVPKFPPL